MRERPYELEPRARMLALQGILECGRRRDWRIWAVHVRLRHVHVVAEAACKPEPVLLALKSYASRRINQECNGGEDRLRRWARHGSTLYLFDARSFHAAMDYVVNRQGDPMELFVHPEWDAGGSAVAVYGPPALADIRVLHMGPGRP